MGGVRSFVVTMGLVAGCVPSTAQPQYAQQQPYQQQPYQQQPYPQQPQQQPADPNAAAQQPGQLPEPQPAPPQPVQQAQPQPYPAQQPPVQQQQPYPQQQPYEQPRSYEVYGATPQQQSYAPTVQSRSHFYDGEVIADFATVGVLAGINLAVRQDIEDGNALSLVIGAGLVGGGGLGYLLTQKYEMTAGAAHTTTMGLMLGIANGALLIQPTDYHDASSIMGLLTLGSLVGTAGGFVYGQTAELTSGQSLFIGNLMVLGSGTASLTALTGNRDGNYGGFENTTLALGLDGGAVLGAIIAPHLDWSPRRSKIVFASTFIGALGGALVAGTLAKPRNGDTSDTNSSIVTGAMTAGLWGGFGAGILLTRDTAPDPGASRRTNASASGGTTSFAPWVGANGQLGVMSGGTF